MAVSTSQVQSRLYGGYLGKPDTQQNTMSGWGTPSDWGQGILNGAEESVKAAWNILDWATGDYLPDYKETYFDAPQSTAGGVIGSIAQFAIPYMGLGKILKGGAAVAGAVSEGFLGGGTAVAAAGARTQKALNWLRGAEASGAAKAANSALAAGDPILAASRAMVWGSAIARETIKGGIVDYVAFEGTGGRIADLIEERPELSNAITGWLASDEEDPEYLARFKNVLEGAALGGAFDTLLGFRRGLIAGRKVKKAKGSPEAVKVAEINALDDTLEAAKANKKLIIDTEIKAKENETILMRTEEGTFEPRRAGDVHKEIEEQVQSYVDTELSAILDSAGIARADVEPGKAGGPDLTRADEERFMDFTEELSANRGMDRGIEDNPRKLSADERELKGIKSVKNKNFSQYAGTPEGGRVAVRAIENLEFKTVPDSVKTNEFLSKALAETARLGGMTPDEFKMARARLLGDPQAIDDAGMRAAVFNHFSMKLADEWSPRMMSLAERVDITDAEFREAAYIFKTFTELQQGASDNLSAFGRNLNLSSKPLNCKYAL
jgi:hypothetical protein